ncbi:MAG TPA: hypothetical protein VEL76_33580 [Gemmataceae bacterium]|nr:hypothetical protein [Gemmataceae bacterium]
MRGSATVLALLVGCCTVAAQERPAANESETAPAPSRGNWFTRLFPFGRKAEEKKPPPETDSPPTVVESAARVKAREEAALNRRRDVILKLQAIAISTRDEQLLRKVDELDTLAWDTYLLRTAHLSFGTVPFTSDEQILDQRVGQRAADGRALSTGTSGRSPGVGGVAARRE